MTGVSVGGIRGILSAVHAGGYGGRPARAQDPSGLIDRLLPIAQILLSLCSIGLAVYWSIVLFHVLRTMRRIPTAAAGVGLAELRALPGEQWPRVCVVVPAHNEQETIGAVAKALRAAEYPNLDVVFSLDRCTDNTAPVLRTALDGDPRFRIIEVEHCPPDWAGKVHAIWRGVQDTDALRTADILLFIDADTQPAPGCVTACVGLMRARSLGMLSLLSTLTHDEWFEKVVQTCAGMELARQYPIERANALKHRRAFANGQFLMLTREAYNRIGGHEAVRQALLEDMDIARRCERLGVPAGLFLADGMHTCRMYESWEQFVRGWKRIYTECANRRVNRLRKTARRTRLVGAVLPLAAAGAVGAGLPTGLALGDAPASASLIFGTIGLGAWLLALGVCHHLARAPVWTAILHPVAAWLTGGILHGAADDLVKKRPTVWGGREYAREARE